MYAKQVEKKLTKSSTLELADCKYLYFVLLFPSLKSIKNAGKIFILSFRLLSFFSAMKYECNLNTDMKLIEFVCIVNLNLN